MQYVDPVGLFSFRYPMGWVYAPERSSTGAVILEHFDPEQATLRVDVFPSASPWYSDPGAWSEAMERSLSRRIDTDIALRLLPDDETATGIERNPSDRQNRRLVAFRGDLIDVALTVESAQDHDGPFMIDTIRLARSSFRRHEPEADQADVAAQSLGLVRDDWRQGRLPQTRNVVGAAHAIREQALAQSVADPVFTAAVLLDQQLNAVQQIPGGDESEVFLLNHQIAEVRNTIAAIFRASGLRKPSLGHPAEVAEAHASLIRHLYGSTGDHTPIDTAMLHARALAELLTSARSKGGTLRHLWAVMSDPERVSSEAGIPAEVLDGIGWLASVLADSSFDLGERADCQEADSVASAALRSLFAQRPAGKLGGAPIRIQLMYRLLATSIHLRANQDPPGIEEANQLRAEVGKLDPSGDMAKIHDQEDQRVAFDNLMLLPNMARNDPLAEPTSRCRWAQMWLALGDEQSAATALSEARQALAQVSVPSPPTSVPELVRLSQVGDLYLDLAEVCRRLGRTDDALDLLGQARAHSLPVVSRSSFNLMRVAARVHASVDPTLATRWADGAAVIADGLRLSSRPGEDRIRFADSALLQQTYNTAIAGHLAGGDLYGAISMADRSRGRFLFESIGSGDKTVSMVEHLTDELSMPADPLPPAFGGPANALASIEPVAEGLGVAAAPVLPEGLPRDLDEQRSAVLGAVTRECAATRTPVPLSPARVAGMSLYLRNVLLIQESGDDLILFLLGVGRTPAGSGGDAASTYVLSQEWVHHVRVQGSRRRPLDAV
jgi:hypothetical protein